ncbi:uncharacterized protein N7482_009720 [Penicillium canariense]|uniref:C2H2-type domain-containing protein n=1 Tax=Penicillium canariense TaxID=189055 RepID=A0A9W9HPY6_9EURO|nr:uncharacterized protein N7482_009720 [Penicillium canariense]KAJ5153242.1 hypothetical protein N7482_009720 [Penicillium canariense]
MAQPRYYWPPSIPYLGPLPPLNGDEDEDPPMSNPDESDDFIAMTESQSTIKTQLDDYPNQGQPHAVLMAGQVMAGPDTNSSQSSQLPSLGYTGNTTSISTTEDHVAQWQLLNSESTTHDIPQRDERDSIVAGIDPNLYDRHRVPQVFPNEITLEELRPSADLEWEAISPATTVAQPPEPDPARRPTTREERGIPGQESFVSGLGHASESFIRLIDRHHGPEQRSQIQRCLQTIMDRAADDHEVEQLPTGPPEAPNRQVDRIKPTYQCPDCGFISSNRHVFKRHVDDKHYHECEYLCPFPRCPYVRYRKDKIQQHCNQTHHETAVQDAIERRKNPFTCPPICPICTVITPDWDAFWLCYLEHCLISVPPSNAPSSSQGTDNHGNGPHRDPFGGSSYMDGHSAGGPSLSMPGNSQPGNAGESGYRRSGPETSGRWRTNARHRSCTPSVPRTSSARRVRPRARAANPPRSPTTAARNNPRGGVSRPRRQRPTVQRPREQPSTPARRMCNNCRQLLNDCSGCSSNPQSTNWCHVRLDAPVVAVGQVIQPQNGPYIVDTPPASQVVNYIDPSVLSPEAGFLNQIMPTMVPSAHRIYEAMRHRQQEGAPHRMASPMGTQQSTVRDNRPVRVLALSDVLVHGMSETQMESAILASKTGRGVKKAQMEGLWPVILPYRIPRLHKPLKGVSTIPFGGLEVATRQAIGPSTFGSFTPSSECQCQCRTGSADLAPGRRVEINFKLARGGHGTGHPLQTRVQVVVRMLRLRSSVAKTAHGQHKKEAKAALKEALESTLDGSEITTKEDLDDSADDSDVDSIADSSFSASSSRRSSCTDLTLLSPPRPSSPTWWSCDEDTLCGDGKLGQDSELIAEEEKELELGFDLDLPGSLNKLARWSGVSTDDACSGLSFRQSDQVFEYFMKYLVFVIFSLARSRDRALFDLAKTPGK